MDIWQYISGIGFTESPLVWPDNYDLADAIEHWGFNSSADTVYGDREGDHIEVYSGKVKQEGAYLCVHSNVHSCEIIHCPSYPELLAYLALAVPLVMAAVESYRYDKNLVAISSTARRNLQRV